MTPTVPLGRIAGVRVGMNWSVVVVFGLIAWGLATVALPDEDAGLPSAAYAAGGVAGAALYLLSLLAHELAHAIVARRNGVGVEGITLWLFGGVSRLEGEAATAGADFRIAGAGPLTSLCLAIAFGACAAGAEAAGRATIAVAVLAWLSATNGLLAVFNALPAAPLDGGRLLRAFL